MLNAEDAMSNEGGGWGVFEEAAIVRESDEL
jgi:hypothetical protein